MGTYVLALWLNASHTISVGRLGRFVFPSGWYLYVGSARGPGGLRARLQRHRRRVASGKRAHWHVDHLREHAVWGGAWVRCSGQQLECIWADALRGLPGATTVAQGFGASDCRCLTHLVRVSSMPGADWFAGILGAERLAVATDEIEELLEVLVSGDDDGREEAALALGRFGIVATGRLADILATGESSARWWAARALAEVGGEDAVQSLVSLLGEPDPDLRACAALALGRIGDGSAASALAAKLDDQSSFVAGVASDALSMLGDSAVEALAGRLGDENPHTRLLAVRALGRIGSDSAAGPLVGVLEDPSYLVRYYAQEALDALGVGILFLVP